MKLKYYLRGLGIGIVVTALLLGATGNDTVKANQSFIEEELTSVEAETAITEEAESAIDSSEEQTIEDEAQPQEDASTASIDMIQEEMQSEEQTPETEPVQEQTQSDLEAEINTQEYEEEAESVQTPVEDSSVNIQDVLTAEADAPESYLLNVVRGDDSGTVSRKLQNAGLIDSAAEFDAYLMQHGYDKTISVGTVEIPMGATWIEIAEKLSGK